MRKEKTFKSKSVNFNCSKITNKYLFEESNITTIKSIRINSPHDTNLQVLLICNGYSVQMNSNKTYTYNYLVNQLQFLELATMDKYCSDVLWISKLQEYHLKIDN